MALEDLQRAYRMASDRALDFMRLSDREKRERLSAKAWDEAKRLAEAIDEFTPPSRHDLARISEVTDYFEASHHIATGSESDALYGATVTEEEITDLHNRAVAAIARAYPRHADAADDLLTSFFMRPVY